MTIPTAEQALYDGVERLWQAVSELVLTVHEDRPVDTDLVVVDDLAEQVSELQGDIAAVREILEPARAADADTFARLPYVAARLDAAGTRYWRELRAYGPVGELRRAARRGGGEFSAWQRSVDASVQRCEEPLTDCVAALHARWRELCRPLATPSSRRSS
jgi:hypothetical protein